jgi:hypothetical protein
VCVSLFGGESVLIAQSTIETKTVAGIVERIDVGGKTFTVKNLNGKETKFLVNERTNIKRFDAPATFKDIKLGTSIGIRYLEKTDAAQYEAVAIRTDGEIPPPLPIVYLPRTNRPPVIR